MTVALLEWENEQGTKTLVECDAIVSFRDTLTAEVTEHPIEDGSSITDHIIHKPKDLTIEINHSNEPVGDTENYKLKPLTLPTYTNAFKAQGLFLIHSAAGNLVGAVLGGKKREQKPYIWQPNGDLDRIVELHDKLIEAWNEGAAITTTQFGRTYPDYVITAIEYTREGNGKGGLAVFRIDLKTVRTVETATTELPAPEDLHAKGSKDRGAKPGKGNSDDPSSVLDSQTIAYSILNEGLGGLVSGL